ncbi:MAG: hypothetical protein LBC98_09400 [Prevotellaceae bacterium]|jgi:hypothetical protein|nr:hypothetical protein [Prevotellaceae bacterium]
MIVIDIDETTEIGRDILRQVAENPKAGKLRDFEIPLAIPRDENGKPIGYTVDEVFAKVDKILSEGYGVDFAKVHRMIESGELNDADLSDELLNRPEFAYKPYPKFKPKPLPENFKPKPWLLDALSDE